MNATTRLIGRESIPDSEKEALRKQARREMKRKRLVQWIKGFWKQR